MNKKAILHYLNIYESPDEKTLSLRTLTDKEIELIYQLLNYIEYIKNHNQ